MQSRYDLKHLYRLILNSQTYQLSSVPESDKPEAEANFASYPLRRLDAEVLIDALNQITGTTEKYSSAIPEPFTFIPEDQRSIALPDGSITSSFLELFGRPPRDTGLESERNNRITAGSVASAELQSYPAQDRAEPDAAIPVARQQAAARNHHRHVSRHPFAVPDGGGSEDRRRRYAKSAASKREAVDRIWPGP